MRSSRIVAVVLALALAAFLPFTSGATASASTTSAAPTTGTSATVDAQISQQKVKGKKTFFLIGKVSPKKGPVYIQKATKCNKKNQTCNFKFYRKVFLKDGRFKGRIDAPNTQRGWVWRAKVGNSVSDAFITCRVRPGQQCKVPY